MKDVRQIRANERIKAIATILFNLGSGLFAAAVVKIYYRLALDIDSVVWLTFSAILLYVAWLTLGLLAEEDL